MDEATVWMLGATAIQDIKVSETNELGQLIDSLSLSNCVRRSIN